MKKKQADLILVNGTVFTLDDTFSTSESFAVKDGKILETGTSTAIQQKYASPEIIDAHGKFVYPGFNDAHSHFNTFGEDLIEYADLSHTNSPEEIYDILVKHYEKFGEDWVLGLAWDQNDWQVQEFPDKSGLDKLFPETPVYIIRTDIHSAWCNSKALEIGGVTADTKVDGGEIVLKNGEPSGILIDNAMKLVSKHIPEITKEQRKKGLDEAQKRCFAVGLTSVTDCGLHKKEILTMQEMHQKGRLKIRINAMMKPTVENYQAFLKKDNPLKTERLVVNTIKVFADGALGSRSALLMDDYLDDSGNHGLQLASKDFYEETCRLAYNNNFLMATHCIGDGANRFILDTYGKFLKRKNDRRWRIEHAQFIHPDDFEKFGRFSIIPSVQVTHATSEMEWVDQEVSREQLKGAYAYQTLLKQNGWLPNGTDFPVEAIEPLNTFYSAVFRINHEGWPEGGWRTEEALTREQALRSITIWPAKASFEEYEKGSIEPGKYADFVILNTDLMNASPKEVLNAKIESTWIAGEKVY